MWRYVFLLYYSCGWQSKSCDDGQTIDVLYAITGPSMLLARTRALCALKNETMLCIVLPQKGDDGFLPVGFRLHPNPLRTVAPAENLVFRLPPRRGKATGATVRIPVRTEDGGAYAGPVKLWLRTYNEIGSLRRWPSKRDGVLEPHQRSDQKEVRQTEDHDGRIEAPYTARSHRGRGVAAIGRCAARAR